MLALFGSITHNNHPQLGVQSIHSYDTSCYKANLRRNVGNEVCAYCTSDSMDTFGGVIYNRMLKTGLLVHAHVEYMSKTMSPCITFPNKIRATLKM